MARKGWFLIIFLFFLSAVATTIYFAIPFFISKSLGKKVHYSGYKIIPWWTLSFQKFEAESLFYATNLRVSFKFFPLVRNHEVYRFTADSIVIFLRAKDSGQRKTSQDNVEFGFKNLPVLVKELRLGNVRVVANKHIYSLNSVDVITRPWETYWRMSGLAKEVSLDTFPPHQVKFYATLHTDRVFLENLRISGPLIYLLAEGQTVGGAIKLKVDTTALFSRIALSNSDIAIDLRKKSVFLNTQRIVIDTFQLRDVKLRATDLDTLITIDRLGLTYGKISVSGEGTYNKLRKSGKAAISLAGKWKDISLAEVSALVEGNPSNISGEIAVSRGKYRDLPIKDLKIDFYAVGKDSLVIKSFTSEQPPSSGTIVFSRGRINLNVQATRIDLSRIFSGVNAFLSLKLIASGPLIRPKISGKISFSHLNLQNVRADTGEITVTGVPDSLVLLMTLPEATVFNQVVQGTELSAFYSPEKSVFVARASSGMLKRIKIRGSLKKTDMGIKLRADTILLASPELHREWLGNLTANKTRKNTWFTVNARDVKGGSLKILGNMNKNIELTMQMEDFALSGLPLPRPFDGSANMTLDLTGSINNPNLMCDVSWRGSIFAGNPMDSVSLKWRYSDDTLLVENAKLSIGESEIRVNGLMQIRPEQVIASRRFLNAPIDFNVTSWHWDITDLFNSISTDYYTDSMSFTGDVRITGTVNNPQFSGSIEVGGGPVALLPAGTVFQSLFARGTVEKNRITFEKAIAKSPGTSVTGTGYVTLTGFNLDTVNLKLRLNNFDLRPQPEVEAWLNGALEVKGKFPRLNIDGDLEASKGYITVPFGRRSSIQQVEAPSPLRYRIHLTASDRLYFINDVLQTEFKCDLTVTKDSDIGSTYSGTLTALGGTFWYLDRGFRITEGELVFNQSTSLNPDINLKAEYLLQDSILVTLSATGTLQEPQVNLVSTPPMPLEDIVSLLAFGRRVAELSPALTEVSYLRSRSLNLAEALLSRELKQRLRLTELEIATGLAGRDPHFTVGFYLSPRVHLRYTHDIKSPTKDVFLLNYYLTRGMGIYVERDRDGRLGGGLNFRFRF